MEDSAMQKRARGAALVVLSLAILAASAASAQEDATILSWNGTCHRSQVGGKPASLKIKKVHGSGGSATVTLTGTIPVSSPTYGYVRHELPPGLMPASTAPVTCSQQVVNGKDTSAIANYGGQGVHVRRPDFGYTNAVLWFPEKFNNGTYTLTCSWETADPNQAIAWETCPGLGWERPKIDDIVKAELNKTKKDANGNDVAIGPPGISIAIAKDGVMVFAKAYGVADKDKDPQTAGDQPELLTPKHRLRIASVSKPITSVAILRLMEQGKLSLDDKVFGEGALLGTTFGTQPYSDRLKAVTVRHLLQHTAGGEAWTNNGNDPMFKEPARDLDSLINWTLTSPTYALLADPGTSYRYSNFGYALLGRIVEKVSGMSYEQFVKDNVLVPSGVTDMEIAGNTLAERKTSEVKYYPPASAYSMNVRRMAAHGGWIAPPAALVRFGTRVDGFATRPDILAPATIQIMTTKSALSSYALGWSVNSVPNWWHEGYLPGTKSNFVRTNGGYVWAAIVNGTNPNGADDINLDAMMWRIVNSGASWPGVDQF